MRRLMVLASMMVLAGSSVSCSRDQTSPSILSSPVAADSVQSGPNGKGKHAPVTSSLELVMYNDVNGNGLPNWGDSVTFHVSTSEDWNQVTVTCFQDGVGVFGAVWPMAPVVTLSSSRWTGGGADCTATLEAFSGSKINTIASMDFTAGQ